MFLSKVESWGMGYGFLIFPQSKSTYNKLLVKETI